MAETAARAPPGEHAGGGELLEKSLATEVAEDASLDDRLHLSDAIGRQVMGLVKPDLGVERVVRYRSIGGGSRPSVR